MEDLSEISPTMRHVFEKNPNWFMEESTMRARGFTRSHDFDRYGYDMLGFDKDGVDRAGYSKADYSANPRIEALVQACGEEILAGRRKGRSFRQLVETTDVIVSELQSAYPASEFYDADTLDPVGTGTIVREAVAGGNLSVAYRRGVNYIAFTTDETAETYAEDPRDAHGLIAYSRDLAESYEIRHCSEGDEELRGFVREIVADFRPDLAPYTVYMIDTEDGPALDARVYGKVPGDDEDEFERQYVEGDPLGDVLAASRDAALCEFMSKRNKTHALADMFERGIARLEGPAATGTEFTR